MTQMSGIGAAQIASGATDRTERLTKRDESATSASAPTQAGSAADGVTFSGAGTLLATSVTSGEDIRSAKVEALRSAISSGAYNPPAGAVADKLIRNMLD